MSEYAVGSITALPRYIQVHRQDNVAIVVNDHGLPKGASFPCGLTLLEHIPQGHKVALQDIPQDGTILRYGEVIGFATRDIRRGSWIDESLVLLPRLPSWPACHSPTMCPKHYRPWKVIPLKATVMPTVALAARTCWLSPPACTAWPVWWIMW